MTRSCLTRPTRDERGIALVTAILFVLIAAALAGAFMAVAINERVNSSNVAVSRTSLYAADAGVRTAQQYLANVAKARLDSLAAHQTGSGPVISQPTLLFPIGTITRTSTNPRFSASATIAWADSDLSDSAQVYRYRYTITSTGNAGPVGARTVQTSGILQVSAGRGTFADYLMFTQYHKTTSNSKVWFTSNTHFDGRVHTNDEFCFQNHPTFQDQATSVNSKAWFYNNSSSNNKELAANFNGTIDVPSFGGGFTRGAGSIPLPTETNQQMNAALGIGGTTAPTNNTINVQLGRPSSGSAPPNGVYLPRNSTGFTGGGIYVQGNLDECRMTIVGGNQVYRLTQGSNVTTLTIDRTAHTITKRYNASADTIIHTDSWANQSVSGSLYVTGGISSLTGPARATSTTPTPTVAIADGTQMTITAGSDIVIQSDLMCGNYDTGGAVLGVYSSGGSVRLGTSTPNDVCLDCFIMAIGPSGTFSVDNYSTRNPQGLINLRGGMVSTYYGPVGTFDSGTGQTTHGYGRNFTYDRRGYKPPFYPSTPLFDPNAPTAQVVAWKEL